MRLPVNTELLRQRRQKLESAGHALRRKFIGINQVIDGVLHAISTWYCFPHLQERCLVINLWGMIGTGKTSLVQELVRELDLEERYNHFDMRRGNDPHRKLENAVLESLDAVSGQAFVMAFDEFQHARTLDEAGYEIAQPTGNLVWQLIGNPVFQPVESTYGQDDLKTIISELEWLIAHGLEAEKGIVTRGTDLFREFCQYSRFFRTASKDESAPPLYLVPRDLIVDIWEFCKPAFPTQWELKCAVSEFNAPETLGFLKQRLLEMGKGTQIHSKAGLVFIIGNLDEAYSYSRSLSFGDDPDFHYSITSDIPVIRAKRALQKRFRPEQIARLGNNFFLYTALNRKSYGRIIRQELERVAARFNELTMVPMRFQPSVNRMLLAEAVQPSLGTRPVFTSIQRWIESCLGIWVMGLAENKAATAVEVKFIAGQLRVVYLNAGGHRLHQVVHRPEG